MRSSFPFASDFLRRDWPLLLACCALPADPDRFVETLRRAGPPEALLRLADEHGVAGRLSQMLAHGEFAESHEELLTALRASARSQVLTSLSLTAELFRVLELLEQQQISSAVVKGPVLSWRAFGDAAARPYGDIDLLLRHADIRRASEILTSAGYQARVSSSALRAGKTPGQYLFRRRQTGAAVELHTQRTLRYFPRPLPIEEFFQRKTTIAIEGHVVPALAIEDELVLVCVHGTKHLWERLMWIADVAALAHRHPELDWQRVKQTAEEVGAGRMVRVGLLLAERLLRVAIPPAMRSEVASDPACVSIAKKIESWLPYAGYEPPPLAQRALFRLRMRGHLLAGASYLTRLSFATTEEDWTGSPARAASLSETLRRPLRLVRKYRRTPRG